MKKDNFDVKMSVITHFFILRKKIFKDIKPIFQEENLLPTEVLLLMHIKNKDYKVLELAEEVGMPASTLTGVIDRLVDKGFVERSRNEKDRRVVIIKLGKKSYEMKEKIDDKLKNLSNQLNSDLPDDWWDMMEKELSKLEQAIDNKGVIVDGGE